MSFFWTFKAVGHTKFNVVILENDYLSSYYFFWNNSLCQLDGQNCYQGIK